MNEPVTLETDKKERHRRGFDGTQKGRGRGGEAGRPRHGRSTRGAPGPSAEGGAAVPREVLAARGRDERLLAAAQRRLALAGALGEAAGRAADETTVGPARRRCRARGPGLTRRPAAGSAARAPRATRAAGPRWRWRRAPAAQAPRRRPLPPRASRPAPPRRRCRCLPPFLRDRRRSAKLMLGDIFYLK